MACTLHKLVSQLLTNRFPSRDGGWGVGGSWRERRETGRETDRQTGRQTERETDRYRQTQTETESVFKK